VDYLKNSMVGCVEDVRCGRCRNKTQNKEAEGVDEAQEHGPVVGLLDGISELTFKIM
jgi:hypothetical protein